MHTRRGENIEEVCALFASIRAKFEDLRMEIERQHPNVELNMDIPRQSGLGFDVNVNLQGDELHLGVGALALEWYPCDSPEAVAGFREAVEGILGGTFRVVEDLRRGRPVGACLQKPTAGGWETLGRWGRFHLPIGAKSTRVLQNVSGET